MMNRQRPLIFSLLAFVVFSTTCYALKTNLRFSLNYLHTYSPDMTEDFKEITLIIESDSLKIGGTLLIPNKINKSALVIMSSGSGQQDRDETLDGFKIFRDVAEHLANQGIPSFRYDDRSVGDSTGDFVNSNINDFSEDIVRIMSYFENISEFKFERFILFGHSLGGIIAGDVASKNDNVEQVILMASPSKPLVDLILFQERQDYQMHKIPRDLIEAEVSSHNKLINGIVNNLDIEDVVIEFEENVRNILKVHPLHKGKEPAVINRMARDKAAEFLIVYSLPCIESYLYHDPSESISKLKIPVLALFGAKDLQVTIDQNKDRLEDALLDANTNFDIKIFNSANHYFQKAITGTRDEYESLHKQFVKGFLESISNWILMN